MNFFLSFDGEKTNGNEKAFPLSVLPVPFRQGLPKAMHFTLDEKGVSVYTLRPKDIILIRLRHFLDDFRADFAHDLALYHTSKILRQYILVAVFLIAHLAEDIFIQNVGYDIRL